ncbi:MAG TPA: diacylglycerol kinase family protein [Gaiellales bacterium]|jgi:diacylglycerol kinase family enzyme
MRVRLIVNAAATGVRGRVLDAVVASLEAVSELEVVTTEHAGHATELAAAVSGGAVVGLGGDGTYNEIANGVRPGTLMGVLPAGASSVFARHMGFPNDPIAAAADVAAAIQAGSTRKIGLGVAGDRLFTFAAGLGLDAEATAIVDRARHKRPGNERPGDLRVLATALGVLRREGFALHERMTLRAAAGDAQRCSYVAVANQHPYTFLGPIPVRAAPRADFEHGLDVVFTRELRARDLWRLPVYGLIWPRHAKHGSRRVGYLHDLHSFTIECDEPTALQLDGEYVGHRDRVEFSYRPDAIEVLVPPG